MKKPLKSRIRFMNKKIIFPLLAILVILVGVATVGSFMLSGNSFQNQGNVSIAITGDVMLGRKVPAVLGDGQSPFRGVSNVTSNVDLLLINFENAATYSTSPVKGDVPLKCDPSYVPLARANNNTVAALANNHATDYGEEGMKDTFKALEDANITYLGAGETEDEAHTGVSKEINGRNITILNYMDSNNFAEYSYDQLPYANGSSPGYSAYDSENAQEQITKAKESGNIVIVFMHYGNEYSMSPNDAQKNISHELIDYGADVVVGAHPHVVQGVEMYNGKPIFYSMGDFIFDLSRPGTLDAYMIQIDFVNDTGECTVYPIRISNYLPQFMDETSGTNLLNSLSPQCSDMEIEDGVGKLKFNLTNGD